MDIKIYVIASVRKFQVCLHALLDTNLENSSST